MALEVEDGSGKANAQCYRDATNTAAYLTAKGNTTFAALTVPQQEAAILNAQEFMRDQYGSSFSGYRSSFDQALDFPRTGVQKQGCPAGYFWDTNLVPTLVADAESDLALKASIGALIVDLKQAKKSVKVGPIAIEYDGSSARQTFYAAVAAKLSQFFGGFQSSGQPRIERT